MGATLTTIGILSEMAKSRVNGNVQTRELIEKISDNSTRMMEAMSDIVWSINPNNDSMQKIVARMREYASTVMDAKNIDYRFHVDEEVYEIALDMEKRRDLFLIFKESVNNLVKYSQCTFADISISRKEKRLIMLINDNGIGFDMKNHGKGNGLLNIRKRAKIIQGVVEINSTLNKGTRVQLEVPV
jgi:signal transduction histidine kinase